MTPTSQTGKTNVSRVETPLLDRFEVPGAPIPEIPIPVPEIGRVPQRKLLRKEKPGSGASLCETGNVGESWQD